MPGVRGKDFRPFHPILGVTDSRQREPRLHGAFIRPNLPQRLLHDRELIGRVVDHKIAREADMRRLPAKQACAQGVERRDPHAPTVHAEQRFDARAHLLRRLVGEGDGQQPIGLAQPLADQVSDAVGDDTRFPGPGAGQDQQRPGRMENGFLLFRVEGGKQVHL
jgi:hypothetical protein